MAKTYVVGDAVTNATSYELFEKDGNTYNKIATQDKGGVISFEVSALIRGVGSHVLAVKAHADSYESSDYSEPVTYTVEEANNLPAVDGEVLLAFDLTSKTLDDYVSSGVLKKHSLTNVTYTADGMVGTGSSGDSGQIAELAKSVTLPDNFSIYFKGILAGPEGETTAATTQYGYSFMSKGAARPMINVTQFGSDAASFRFQPRLVSSGGTNGYETGNALLKNTMLDIRFKFVGSAYEIIDRASGEVLSSGTTDTRTANEFTHVFGLGASNFSWTRSGATISHMIVTAD